MYGRVFQLIESRPTWGEYRVFFQDDSGQLRRIPQPWTDLEPTHPAVMVGAGRAHFRYDDLIRLVELVTRLSEARAAAP